MNKEITPDYKFSVIDQRREFPDISTVKFQPLCHKTGKELYVYKVESGADDWILATSMHEVTESCLKHSMSIDEIEKVTIFLCQQVAHLDVNCDGEMKTFEEIIIEMAEQAPAMFCSSEW